jgi:hypothetical protein
MTHDTPHWELAAKFSWGTLDHPLCSPRVTSSNIRLFSAMKENLLKHCFTHNEDVKKQGQTYHTL